jgi:Restriction endonuclease
MKKDRTRNDKGKILEQVVAMLHDVEGVKVETNVKLTPKSGDKSRTCEFDVLVTSQVAGYPIRVAIQCKNYSGKVTRAKVGEFKDALDDVGIPYQHGIIVCVHGFQSGAIKRAQELGIRTLELEGLSSSRLSAELHNAVQYFIYLLLVVEKVELTNALQSTYDSMAFWDDTKKFCGFLSDLIVSKWRSGQIPSILGKHTLELKLPRGWHHLEEGKLTLPSRIAATVSVVAYLAEMKGKATEFKLKDAKTKEVEKFHLRADFDAENNIIRSVSDMAILTDDDLRQRMDPQSKASLENRVRLPKILYINHLEPVSKRLWAKFMKEVESDPDLSFVPDKTPTFDELEGDLFHSMGEEPQFGFPVHIELDGILVDVSMLVRKQEFGKILGLKSHFGKHSTEEFAEILKYANSQIGRQILGQPEK